MQASDAQDLQGWISAIRAAIERTADGGRRHTLQERAAEAIAPDYYSVTYPTKVGLLLLCDVPYRGRQVGRRWHAVCWRHSCATGF